MERVARYVDLAVPGSGTGAGAESFVGDLEDMRLQVKGSGTFAMSLEHSLDGLAFTAYGSSITSAGFTDISSLRTRYVRINVTDDTSGTGLDAFVTGVLAKHEVEVYSVSLDDELDASCLLDVAQFKAGTVWVQVSGFDGDVVLIDESLDGSTWKQVGSLAADGYFAGTQGDAATGTITCLAKADYDDTTDTVVVSDGYVVVTFEFDPDGDGVSDEDFVPVNISGATDAASVAALLATAIAGTALRITVLDNEDGTLSLTHNETGTHGNVTITETVTDADFDVDGMSGGTDGGVNPSKRTRYLRLRVGLYDAGEFVVAYGGTPG